MATSANPVQPEQDTPTPLMDAKSDEPKSERTPQERRARLEEIDCEIERIQQRMQELEEGPKMIDFLNKEVDRLEQSKASEDEIARIGRRLGDLYVDLETHKNLPPILKGELRKLKSERDELKQEMVEQGDVDPEVVGVSDRQDDEAMRRMAHDENQGQKQAKTVSTVAATERSLKADRDAGLITKAEYRKRLREVRHAAKRLRKNQASQNSSNKKGGKKTDKK